MPVFITFSDLLWVFAAGAATTLAGGGIFLIWLGRRIDRKKKP